MIITKALPLSRLEFYFSVLCIAVAHQASIVSGYRTEERNRLVGGVENSKHRDAYAFDLIPDSVKSSDAIVAEAIKMGFDAVNEGDHVHIEHDPHR